MAVVKAHTLYGYVFTPKWPSITHARLPWVSFQTSKTCRDRQQLQKRFEKSHQRDFAKTKLTL